MTENIEVVRYYPDVNHKMLGIAHHILSSYVARGQHPSLEEFTKSSRRHENYAGIHEGHMRAVGMMSIKHSVHGNKAIVQLLAFDPTLGIRNLQSEMAASILDRLALSAVEQNCTVIQARPELDVLNLFTDAGYTHTVPLNKSLLLTKPLL